MAPRPRSEQRGPVGAHRVGLDDPDLQERADDLLERPGDPAVGLDRQDRAPAAASATVSQAQARADLEDALAGRDAGVGDDRAGEVRVGEEMLAESLRGPESVAGGEVLQVRAAEAAGLTR